MVADSKKREGYGVKSDIFFLVLPVYCYQPISLHPRAHMLSHVIPWTSARQTPLSVDFSRQEYWSGLPFPSPKSDILSRGNNMSKDIEAQMYISQSVSQSIQSLSRV